MKYSISLLLVLFFCGALAQKQETMLVIDYDFYINFKKKQHFKSTLYLDGTKQLFTQGDNGRKIVEENDAEGSSDFSVTLFESDSIGSYNYIDFAQDTIVSRKAWLDKKVYFLKEKLPTIEWKITEEIKEIGSILCQKAFGYFRGRSYEVWFAPEFPMNAGPWKLSGLPGIILKVSDGTGKIRIVFSKIRKEDASLFPTIAIDTSNIISIEQYAALQKTVGQDLVRKLSSKMPRGATIELTDSESLEIFKE